MPKRIFGCLGCLDETVELKLIKMVRDKQAREIFNTTYQCPNCKQECWDTHNRKKTAPYPDEYQHVFFVKQEMLEYDKKLKIYNKLLQETDEEEINRLKQDKCYDPDFEPEKFGWRGGF